MVQLFDSEENEANSTQKGKETPRRRKRGMPDLSSLMDAEPNGMPVIPEKPNDPVPEETPGRPGKLELPPDLQLYLPPDLWRKISGGKPRRGGLIKAHDGLRSTLFQLTTFLPSYLAQEKIRRPVPGLVKGDILNGTLLFSDVSGFTALSERLAVLGPEGAEQLTIIMNRYFSVMLDILGKSGGKLIKFAGDATLVYFPELPEGEQANWAVRAGMRMLQAMSQFSEIETGAEVVNLKMKVGLATGSFLAASVGSAKRMEYGIWGETVVETMKAEETASGPGQLVANEATVAILDECFRAAPMAAGFYHVTGDVEELGDFEIKAGKRRARGAIPLSAEQHEIIGQMETVLQQIKAVSPYLASELVERTIEDARSRRVESEFRPTTVIFCNFTGIEALLAEWGDSGTRRVTAILSAYFNEMHDIISNYGGVVTRIDPYSKGTKMLILFGAPIASEDDSQRAVSAALAMNAALRTLNSRLVKKYARHLPARVMESGVVIAHRLGITSGDTYAGQVGTSQRREYTVMGDDVNLAARLMGAASMGQILISRQVFNEVRDYFIATAVAPVRVKGKSQPIELFQVEGPAEDILVKRVRRRGAMISREKEFLVGMEVLQNIMDGNGTMLAISGAVGIGKSHFADRLICEAMEKGCRVVFNQNRGYDQETPYASWRAVLRSLFGITALDHPLIYSQKVIDTLAQIKLEQRAELLGSLMGVRLERFDDDQEITQMGAGRADDTVSLLSRFKSGGAKRRSSGLDIWEQLGPQKASSTGQMWAPLSGQLSEVERKEIYGALLELIETLAAEKPIVLFFEDAHWMDEHSYDLLCYLSENIRRLPVLLLVAHRGEDERFLRLGKTLVLEGLDLKGTTALVAQVLVSGLAKVIHEQSGGNPLFIDEITRLLQRTQNIEIDDLTHILKNSDTMQKLVLSSIEILPASQRQVLKAAAIIGNEFRVGEIKALLQETIDPTTISLSLRGLADERFIVLLESGVNARYIFRQPLVKDILYDNQPFDSRREMHARLADYLDAPASQRRSIHNKLADLAGASTAGNPAQFSAQIAHHYAMAQQWGAAAEKYYEAGKSACEMTNFNGAIHYYQNGLEVLDKAESSERRASLPSRVQFLAGCGDMAMAVKDYRAALTAYRAAFNHKEREEIFSLQPELITHLSLALILNGEAGESEELMNTFSETYADEMNLAFVACMAWILARNQKESAADWVRRGEDMLSEADTAEWEKGINGLLLELRADYKAAWNLYLNAGMPLNAAAAVVQWGDQLLRAGDVEAAGTHYRAALFILENEASVDACGLARVRYRQAEASWQLGDADLTLDRLQEVSSLLHGCDSELQSPINETVQLVLEQVDKGVHQPWPSMVWQPYDDLLKAAVIFQFR